MSGRLVWVGVACYKTGGELHENVVACNLLKFSIGKSDDYNFVSQNFVRQCSQFLSWQIAGGDYPVTWQALSYRSTTLDRTGEN